MKRAITIVFAGLLMFVVALLAAFASMRLAIHGREIDVPNLAGLSDADAAASAKKLGLDLSVENRFYSGAVAPNHVLSQSPAAGALVRRGSQVRVTESLGGQQLAVPDVVGQPDRSAAVMLRRLQLEPGDTAHLPAGVAEGMVLAQSPPPNSGGMASPKIAILVAAPESDAPAQAYVMPQLIGMTVGSANIRLSAVGLHIASATDPQAAAPIVPDAMGGVVAGPDQAAPVDPVTGFPVSTPSDPAIPPTIIPPAAAGPGAIISSQSPAPGHRVSRAEAIRVTASRAPDPLVPDSGMVPQ